MKKLQELNLCDDFLFFKVMQDTELCRELLEMIFKKPIRKVINQSEKSVKRYINESDFLTFKNGEIFKIMVDKLD